jgi:hypothetical protein
MRLPTCRIISPVVGLILPVMRFSSVVFPSIERESQWRRKWIDVGSTETHEPHPFFPRNTIRDPALIANSTCSKSKEESFSPFPFKLDGPSWDHPKLTSNSRINVSLGSNRQ